MKRTQKSLFRSIDRTRVTVAPQTLKLQGRILQVTYYTHANFERNGFETCAVPLQDQVHSYREPLLLASQQLQKSLSCFLAENMISWRVLGLDES